MAFSNYGQTFTQVTSVAILGTTHALGHKNLIVQVRDGASASSYFAPAQITLHTTTFDVTVRFAASQSGRVIVNGYAGNLSTAANIGLSVPSGTAWSWAGASHGVSTRGIIFALYNDQTSATLTEVGALTVDPTSFGIRLSTIQAHSGYLVLNGFTR